MTKALAGDLLGFRAKRVRTARRAQTCSRTLRVSGFGRPSPLPRALLSWKRATRGWPVTTTDSTATTPASLLATSRSLGPAPAGTCFDAHSW